MIILSSLIQSILLLKIPPPTIVRRFGFAGRAVFIALSKLDRQLVYAAKWLDEHRVPFEGENRETNRTEKDRYSSSFWAKAGAHLGFIRAGFSARTFCYPCDGLPFHWHHQWIDKDGKVVVVNVVRSLFNAHHDKLRMSEDEFRLVFYEVLRLCGEKAGPVQSEIDLEFLAKANYTPAKRSAMIDLQAQAGDNIGQIVKPCLMMAEGVLFKENEPSKYGLDEQPCYYDYDQNKKIYMPGPTKGQIVEVARPMYILRGVDVYAYIIAAVQEKDNLVLMGAMEMQKFLDLTVKTRVYLQFKPDRSPTWWRLMPLASPHWIPMQTFLSGMKGFDDAVKSGLLILDQ